MVDNIQMATKDVARPGDDEVTVAHQVCDVETHLLTEVMVVAGIYRVYACICLLSHTDTDAHTHT